MTTPEGFNDIDQATFREVLGHYPTGVTVVTGMSDRDEPVGMVVGSFSSVSLEPPLVSFMPMTDSQTYRTLRASPVYCINVLAHDQRDECRILSTRDPDKFENVSWRTSRYSVPEIDGAVAYIHCRPESTIKAGDHLIVLCRALEVRIGRPVTPLLFFQGGYGGFSPTSMTARVDASLVSAVKLAEVSRPQLDLLARSFQCTAEAIVQLADQDLVTGAAAYGGSAEIDERLGVRMPLVPPFGDVSVAWSPRRAERWLANVQPREEHLIQQYREHLGRIRAVGYGILPAALDGTGQEDFRAALRRYGEGLLTPADERAMRTAATATVPFFDKFETPAAHPNDIGAMVVPVFDPDAEEEDCGMVLSLRAMPRTASSADVQERIRALQDAASEVTAALAGPCRRDLERYNESGFHDR